MFISFAIFFMWRFSKSLSRRKNDIQKMLMLKSYEMNSNKTDHKIIKGISILWLVSFVHFISHCQFVNIKNNTTVICKQILIWYLIKNMDCPKNGNWMFLFAIRLYCLLHVHKLVHKTTNNLWISSSLHTYNC